MKANDQYGKYINKAELRLVRILPGPIERIWDYLTDPEKRARWFAGGPMEQRVGGKLRLDFRHKNIAPDETPPEDYKEHHEKGSSMTGVVLRCEPPSLLSYTFGRTGKSEVTFELTEKGREVLLVLTHRSRGEDLEHMDGFGAGWHTHFTHLEALLEGAPSPPFWPLHSRLSVEYERLLKAANPD